jgi:DNA-binding IclR family transcriptional regulator
MDDADPTRTDSLHVASLAKGLRVLRAFGDTRTEMSLGELARHTGLGKSGTQRLVHTLQQEGFLDRDPVTRRVRPALPLLELAGTYLWCDPLVALATPKLIELSRRLGASVNLAEPSGGDIVYVTRIPCQRTQFAATVIGRRVPALSTSSGRVMLASLPPAERTEPLARWPLRPFTPRTTLDRSRIAALVEEAAANGWSLSESELILNEIGIAAPILGTDGRPAGAVQVAVSALRWTRARIEAEIVPRLLDTANAITPAARSTAD